MVYKTSANSTAGVVRCTRYAFMPNRLRFCGPGNRDDILEFYANANKNLIKSSITPLLREFETMYPYLEFIARENNIKDPFDERVVDAYWLGNTLTNKISAKEYHKYLLRDFEIKKKVGQKVVDEISDHFSNLSIPHHNFHALNIFRHTGKSKGILAAGVFDQCRISAGKIIEIKKGELVITRKRILVDESGNIYQTKARRDTVKNIFENVTLVRGLKVGDIISIHWGSACEKISMSEARNLQKITNICIEIFNKSHL
jgi:hydrogenase maturation factor